MHNLIRTGYKIDLKPLKNPIGIRNRKIMGVIFTECHILFHTAALLLVEDEKWPPYPLASLADQLKITVHSSSASILTS